MKYGVIQSRNFTVEANNEIEAMRKMSNKWGEVYFPNINDGIKLDTCNMTIYVQEQEPERVIYGECEIIYCGKPVVRSGGSEKTFLSKFYDNDGNEIIDIEPKWNVKLPLEIKSDQIKLAWADGEIKIRTIANVGSKFKLIMTANDERYGRYEEELEIEVVGLW